jgi:hypothetical protein
MRQGKLKPDDAKAIASVAQTLINSYTLQVRAINALGHEVSADFARDLMGDEARTLPALPATATKPNGGAPPNEGIHTNDPLRDGRKAEPKGR